MGRERAENRRGIPSLRLALVGLAVVLLNAVTAAAATIQVEGVSASRPGQEPLVPPSLKQYEGILKNTAFGNFASMGGQNVSASAGGTGSATVGAYRVEIAVKSSGGAQASVDVTLSKGGKAIGAPVSYTLSKGEPLHMEVGTARAPTFIFLTFKGN